MSINKRFYKENDALKNFINIPGLNHEFFIREDSNELMIFFSGYKVKPGLFDFYDVGKELKCNVLFINDNKNEYYQGGVPSLGKETLQESISLIKSIADYLEIDQIITCGANMGAAGALLYGCHMSAKVVAFSPGLELKKEYKNIGSSDVKSTVTREIIDLVRKSSNEISVYIGENDFVDMYNIEILNGSAAFANVTVMSIKDVEDSLSYFKKKMLLVNLFDSHLSNKSLELSEREGVGKALTVDGFADNYYYLNKCYINKNYDDAIIYGKKAIDLNFTHAHAHYVLGLSYSKVKKFKEALYCYTIARSILINNLNYQHAVADCFRHLNELELSRYLHLKILSIKESYHKSHHSLSLIYYNKGDIVNAKIRNKKALKYDPNNLSNNLSYNKQTLRLNK